MRFHGAHFRAKQTSMANGVYVEALFNVNGHFNASFSWSLCPLFHSTLAIDVIDRFAINQSMMQCHGGSYLNRWCEAWQVCWKWKRFHFFSPTVTWFKVRIAYPGSRPPPVDYMSCRIIFRMIANMGFLPQRCQMDNFYSETSFLTCRWNGMQHFWHALFDFTVPLWWAMRIHNCTRDRSARIFTLDNNTSLNGYLFCEALSQHPVENIRNISRDRFSCWKHAVIGVPKAEREVKPERWPNGYDMPYEYPHESVIGFRERILQHFGVNAPCAPDPDHPRVVVTFRMSPKRHIVNKGELIGALSEWCPECTISWHYARNETLQSQLQFVCNASILIGIHGGGLAHMLFQQPATRDAPTAVIEILPFGYRCRKWYRFGAMTARVRYFNWMNRFINNTVPFRGSTQSPCFSGEAECLSDQCHDLLRDQLTTVDLDDFKHVFLRAVRYVSKRSSFDEVDLADQQDEAR
jgi:hypothetical protein